MLEDSLFHRLKERKLVQWAIAYLAGAWVLFEATSTIGAYWNLPDVLFRILFVVLVIGFFLALVLAWFHGEKGQQRVSGPELLMVSALPIGAGVGVLKTLGYAALGATVGAVIGNSIKTDVWAPAELKGGRMSIAPTLQPWGGGLSMALSF